MLRIERASTDEKEGESFPLVVDKVYIVGRKQSDITLADDQSVSRQHAKLEVSHRVGNLDNPLLAPVLSITDSGSKFGTFATERNINSKTRINSRETVNLEAGEKLKFGAQWNEFKLVYTPLVVTTSSMKPSFEFKSNIIKLGGHLVGEWKDGYVTHVVMESVTLTIKIVCALLAAKPIVKPEYITDLLTAFQTKTALPDPKNYVPRIAEKEIANLDVSCFYPNTARTALFSGKTFLFCTAKHLKKMQAAVEAGGGIAELLTKDYDDDESIKSNDYIIMGQPSDISAGEKNPETKVIIDKYRKSGKRFVSDSEVGLAAVHNSTHKFCNPKFNMGHAVMPKIATQSQTGSASIVAAATQDADTQRSLFEHSSKNVVEETAVENSDDDIVVEAIGSRGAKRQLQPESSSAKKRSAVEPLQEPQSKRLKEVASKPSLSLSRSRTTRSKQQSQKSEALKSIFNFGDSDSDDDDEEETASTAETNIGSRSHVMEANDDAGDPSTVPDSQGHESEALVNVVDVRKLQSASSVSQGSIASQREDLEDDVMVVPSSPPSSPPPMISGVAVKNPGTDFIATVRASIMDQKTIAIPPVNAATLAVPQEATISDEQPSSSRKRRREDVDVDDAALVEQTKKINLDDLKTTVQKVDKECYLPRIIRPLLNKNLNLSRDLSIAQINNSDGKPVKNFKTFKKVLPKFMTANTTVVGNGSGSSGISAPSGESIRSNRVVKLVPKDYDPGHGKYYGRTSDVPPLKPKIKTRVEVARSGDSDDDESNTPQAIRDMDLNFSHSEPKGPARNKEPTPSSTSTKTTKGSAQAASSQGSRRVSPRKKTNSQELMPPPKPIFYPVEEPTQDPADDIWSFDQ